MCIIASHQTIYLSFLMVNNNMIKQTLLVVGITAMLGLAACAIKNPQQELINSKLHKNIIDK